MITDDGNTIKSAQPFNLNGSETIFIFVNHDYTSAGTFNPTAQVTDGTNTDSDTMSIKTSGIEVTNLMVLNESLTKRIFEVVIENTLSENLTNVNWTFDSKDSYVINATINALLQPSEELFVYIDYNFTTTGIFNVNATARNGTLTDSRNLSIIIT